MTYWLLPTLDSLWNLFYIIYIIMPNKTTLKNKKQKGGRVVPVTDNQIAHWEPLLCKTGSDCGPNAMTFLGYSTRQQMEELGRDTLGLAFTNPIYRLTYAYNVPHSMTIVYSTVISLQTMALIKRIIAPGHGTLAAFINDSDSGHFAVIAVNQDDDVLYLDPQSTKIYKNEQILLHIRSQGWVSIYLYHQTVLPTEPFGA